LVLTPALTDVCLSAEANRRLALNTKPTRGRNAVCRKNRQAGCNKRGDKTKNKTGFARKKQEDKNKTGGLRDYCVTFLTAGDG
jgi:hypothetical protein